MMQIVRRVIKPASVQGRTLELQHTTELYTTDKKYSLPISPKYTEEPISKDTPDGHLSLCFLSPEAE